MKYLEKTKAQMAAHGPYNWTDIRLWFKKYGLSDPTHIVNSFRIKYCALGLAKCEECPVAGKDSWGQLLHSCGLLVPSCGKTVLIRERVDQDDAENLEKFIKGLNDLRNRCSNRSDTVGSCRDCALKGYVGLNLCGGYRCK